MPDGIDAIGWFESELPPYGSLPESARAGDAAPADWRGNQGFPDWRAAQLRVLNGILWPRSDKANRRWKGPAVAGMKKLTLADFDILQTIRRPGPDRPIDKVPESSKRQLACPPHKDFFDAEDGDASKKVDSQRAYNREESKEILDAIPVLLNRGLGRKCPVEMIFWFKEQMQRPRPYQAGLLLGREISHEGAKTALHPSIISGHCLQGMCGLMGVAERVALDGTTVADSTWEGIEQFCVDFGDRRVMAGVHYPSDNLASWIVALGLCDQVVAESVRGVVKKHLWRAITTRSLVYKLIAGLSNEAFELALTELQSRAPA